MNNDFPTRKDIRSKKIDYNARGAYFITFCAHNRRRLLSEVVVGAIHESPETELTEFGRIVEKIINSVPDRFGVKVDDYVIMPNHVHIIFIIHDNDKSRAIRESPLRYRSLISKIVGFVKMNSSKEMRQSLCDAPIWQRGFYDHVIRNKEDYLEIKRYIHLNPKKWFYENIDIDY